MPLDFTARDVVEAFARTGIEPAQNLGLEVGRRGETCRGCALVALAVDRSGQTARIWGESHAFAGASAKEQLGLDQYKAYGLMAGFDHKPANLSMDLEAYAIGDEARRLLGLA